MHRKGWQKITVCAGVMAALFLTAGADSVLTTTMAGQKELAGMSYLLDQYCTNQQSVGVTDPEAIVAFAATEIQNQADTSVPGQEIPAIDGGIADDTTTDPAAGQQTAPTDPTAAEQQAASTDPAAEQQAAPADPAAGQQAAPADPAATQPQPTPKPESEYKNIGISIAQEYVNVRKKPSTESEVVGKLYRGSAAKIVKRRGEWVKIRSGKVTGYINKEYLAIGFSAEKLIDDFGTKWATVTTETLKVREKKSTDCTILTLIPEGETYKVVREDKDWVKIEVDDTTKGFVAKEYVKIKVRFKKAVSIAEEKAEEERKAAAAAAAAEAAQAEAERKAEAARQAEAARKQAEAARKAAAKKSASKKSSNNSNAGSKVKSSGSGNSSSNKSSISSGNSDAGSVVGSGNGASIASYALKFVGNPYVYGGTSLTHGTDCSGFTQAVFRRFGISLPRTSGGQSGVGAKISVGNAKAGDLIFYASGGRVNHVALCIGNGRVVHASNPSVGITTSNIYYRTPYCARRIVS